jgi:molecular chaperone GrpE (heat shock protein)
MAFGISLFKKEKKETPKIEVASTPEIPLEKKEEKREEKKPEIEVLLAKIDALRFQYEALNEKISNIEKMVKEIYEIAKASK